MIEARPEERLSLGGELFGLGRAAQRPVFACVLNGVIARVVVEDVDLAIQEHMPVNLMVV